jgi:hypothetical protein
MFLLPEGRRNSAATTIEGDALAGLSKPFLNCRHPRYDPGVFLLLTNQRRFKE